MSRQLPANDPLSSGRQAVRDGRFQEALRHLASRPHAASTTAEWHLLRAMALWRVGRFADSLDEASAALDGYRVRGDADGEMRASNVAAAGSFAVGDLDGAEVGFDRALLLARRFNDQLMGARCANNLGNVAYYRGRLDEALLLYRQAVSLFDQAASLRGTAEAWHNIGVTQREHGDLDEARRASDRVLEAAERLVDGRMLAWGLGGRAEVDALLGDLRLGRVEAERALALARREEDRLTEIDTMRILAFIARSIEDLATADALSGEAVRLALEAGTPWMRARTEVERGEVLRALRREDEARAAFAEAAHTFDRLGAESRSAQARALVDDG